MRVITPPEPTAVDATNHSPVVFLAGGITGCPDWQTALISACSDLDVTVLNPRRAAFEGSPENALAQIEWEFKALRNARCISFWFAAESIQPIVLFELGAWLSSSKPILIGVHPDYPRKLDVEIQTALARPHAAYAAIPKLKLVVGWEAFVNGWRHMFGGKT